MIEVFRLNDQGVWELYCYSEQDDFQLNSVNFQCPIGVIYEDVLLEADHQDESTQEV